MDNNLPYLSVFPILKLNITLPDYIAACIRIDGQVMVQQPHITLARFDDLGIQPDIDLSTFPQPPEEIFIKHEVKLVINGQKASCYVEVTDKTQQALTEYVKKCEEHLGLSFLDPNRIFHATITNAGEGHPRSSVGDVWEYKSIIVGRY